MASNRNFVIKMSNVSSNRVIAYEGTSGDVPWQLQGEYTNPTLAKRAIEKYLAEVKPESEQKVKVEEAAPIGETSGNSKRKQRV
jgi:hypothetical protein